MRCIGSSANAVYRQVLTNLTSAVNRSAPRGMGTLEEIGSHITLTTPGWNIVTLPGRKLNHHFMVAEFLWMLSGQNHVDLIEPFNKNIVMASDEGQYSFAGAYGPKIIDQIPYIVDTLRKDSDSRQAVLTIWRERPRASKDIPCTVAMQFFIRGGRLIMCTYMRSNDAWLGFPYDLYNFTMLQMFVASMLGVEVGEYHHFVGSLHLYERDLEKARAVARDSEAYTPVMTKDFDADSFKHLTRVFAAFTELASVAQRAKTGDTRYDKVWRDDWLTRYNDIPEPWRGFLGMLTTRVWTTDGYRGQLSNLWRSVLYPEYTVQGGLGL